MPQLWLTYQEIGDELGCDAVAARDAAIARAWTRKHSRDGQTRVLMPADLMQAYFVARAMAPAPTVPSVPPLEQLRRVWAAAPGVSHHA